MGEREDVYLTRFIPVYGDRITTTILSGQRKRQEDKNPRMSLLEKPGEKIRTGTRPAGKAKFHRSEKALKAEGKIEMGWIHEGNKSETVLGGIRVLNVSKSSTKKDLKSHAKEMSFPHGESTEGKWEDFIHNVSDFEESELVRALLLVSCTHC
ncbi:hypothetical protein AMECASPLE_034661 [Ameca splendens]|uniref:Uncharacterized protein n=1 Tax=Ameca splendens TaxID=208324 RepID=A0ABV0YI85_9TELE